MPIATRCTCSMSLTGFCARDIRECKQSFLTEMDNCYQMSQKKYTRDQIKDAIWQELKESDYAGENNDRAYEIIGIVMAGVDKIVGETQSGAVWLKDQYDKLYDQVKGGKQTVCYVDYNVFGSDRVYRDICTIKAETMEFVSRGHGYGSVRHMSGNEKELFIQLCESIHIEWLCEGTAAGREEDAVTFAEWLDKERNEGGSNWKDMKIWGKETAFKLMHELFKQQKEK